MKKLLYLFLIFRLVNVLCLLASAIYVVNCYLASQKLGNPWMHRVLYLGIVKQAQKLLNFSEKLLDQ